MTFINSHILFALIILLRCLYFGSYKSYLVVGHLQQVEHNFMSSHVLQQPLLLLPNSTAAHLIQPLQDLQRTDRKRGERGDDRRRRRQREEIKERGDDRER